MVGKGERREHELAEKHRASRVTGFPPLFLPSLLPSFFSAQLNNAPILFHSKFLMVSGSADAAFIFHLFLG